ncbi:MAG: DNA repair protein RecN [Chitinophagaceae bacterium]|nr:DNA repair protein RecN [Chitinophagaceae bacterium]
MLQKLHIRNYAIIEEIEISFRHGLTIITGETGAGKSILIGALSLILGERADSKMLLNQEEKCMIEGTFDIRTNENAKQFLIQHDIEADNELIIRRDIAGNGKSRVFINDTPATLNLLSTLASTLIDLHRQFDTQELQQTSEQLHLIDEVCNNKAILTAYQSAYKHWKSLQHQYQLLVEKNRIIKQELDYHQFLFAELETFNPTQNELEDIESELDILNNSEALKTNLQSALYILKDSEDPLLAQLKHIIQQLEPHADKIRSLNDIKLRIDTTRIELKEISSELDDLYDRTHYDEARITQLTDRLNEGNRLLKKHGTNSTNALLELKASLQEKISHAVTADEQEQEFFNRIKEEAADVTRLATQLSSARKKSISAIEEHVNALLKKVGMPNATIQLSMTIVELNTTGMDKIDILFDANKTGKFASISKVASGGELSRLMLCIKSLLAHSTSLPTLIFDEIDTGISGETALQVGAIMKDLSQHHQLICITHLPQIAGKANQHLYIYKEENNHGAIITHMKQLNDDERVDVLAEMLSGKESSSQAKEMVKQLMK